ncbi:hypothetical protein FIV42_23560 [Persicimonas caeni]|uniref:DUF1186 domain-containing protein n=1 Tax=Persicimonas caeni TaxID=2292766 RepID=A0A4Y6PZ79_PERCE|nr:SEC-C metal-binding domain-containing protein [Persicimonas caeni]QDG53612.1 hypothetical protein FIV42_23560 [Persicimonas caeni]QED34833.1 hypothetical protein FRD00_23555 [Persicimonas caeni]
MSENKSSTYTDEEIEARINALFEHGESLDHESRRRIVELGEAATPRLVAIVQDKRLWDDQAPGEGFAPIYAAEILGELRDEEALSPLFDVLREVDPDAILDDAITDSIRAFGQDAIKPGLRKLDSWDDPFLEDLAYVFSGLPVRHEKILQVLLKYFVKNPVPGAELLANYGDPTAIDALEVALDRYIVAAAGDPKYRRPIITLAESIEALGGELTEEEHRVVEDLKSLRTRSEEVLDKLAKKKAPDDSATVKNARDIGRNDPCWCGSGKKYKRCHWAEDNR